MRPLLFILAVAVLLLAAPQVVYDFGGVVVNKTCYLVKTQDVPTVAKSVARVEVDKAAKMLPSARAFVEGLKKLRGVYIRGDEILDEGTLRRAKELGHDQVDIAVEVYIFGNKSLVDHVLRKARGLDVGLTVFYINATAPEYPGREKMTEMVIEWALRYSRIYGNRSYFLGFMFDAPLVVLIIINATDEEADKVAAQMRTVVPCEYPMVYFASKFYYYPARERSTTSGALVVEQSPLEDFAVGNKPTVSLGEPPPSGVSDAEGAPAALSAERPSGSAGSVLLVSLLVAVAALAAIMYGAGGRKR
ncbi:hypothetical protein Pogu_1561 [Pyrobaculum oguniense TE7]|uniref:Uncharacterized protein n=1 Tax=Pyrobaculum oguniense (strain DSM 13380 / JCM 10595 / TE7) TaxID=698757 RepID=H6Q959_PYROT|nr:hypothetical protein Pogu_1561 [Pyrobaculum oguniense TE7]